MRLGILTDIHANREALTAVLDDLAGRRIDRIAILGDIVGYGPDPVWCCERVMQLGAAGALCVMGNHDAGALHGGAGMSTNARIAITWTQGQLQDSHRAYLGGLPLTARLGDVLLAHASANDPGAWSYVTNETTAAASLGATDARLVLSGHVHVPLLASSDIGRVVRTQRFAVGASIPLIRSRRWLAVVGAVGQPRDGVPQAGYAIYDAGTNELQFRRVAYDNAETARKVRAAGLPEALAARLIAGA